MFFGGGGFPFGDFGISKYIDLYRGNGWNKQRL